MSNRDSIGPSDDVQKMDILMRGLTGGDASDGVLAAEAAGAGALAREAALPKDGIQPGVDAGLVKILGEKDDLFHRVELPDGWEKKVGSPDPRGISVLDANGNVRASIFYKAAFYDRYANMHWNHRFRVGWIYPEKREDRARVVVMDLTGEFNPERSEGAVIQDFGPSPEVQDGNYAAQREAEDALKAKALAWLTEHYPDHESVAAYWDEA